MCQKENPVKKWYKKVIIAYVNMLWNKEILWVYPE